jgi:hypothetical protein
MACRLSIRPLAKRVVPTEAYATPAGDIPAMNLRFQASEKAKSYTTFDPGSGGLQCRQGHDIITIWSKLRSR